MRQEIELLGEPIKSDLKLYKYLKKVHADSMVSEGRIRIGTYFDFREQEKLDPQRGDKAEATMKYSSTLDKDTEIRELPELFHQNFKFEDGAKLIIQKGAKVEGDRDASDNYMYCCATIFSDQLMQDFEADVCVEIFDVKGFGEALFNGLVEAGHIYPHALSGECIYEGHVKEVTFKGTAHFLKDVKYSHQAEYRWAFPSIIKDTNGRVLNAYVKDEPDGNRKFRIPEAANMILPKLNPFIFEYKELAKYCRIL